MWQPLSQQLDGAKWEVRAALCIYFRMWRNLLFPRHHFSPACLSDFLHHVTQPRKETLVELFVLCGILKSMLHYIGSASTEALVKVRKHSRCLISSLVVLDLSLIGCKCFIVRTWICAFNIFWHLLWNETCSIKLVPLWICLAVMSLLVQRYHNAAAPLCFN